MNSTGSAPWYSHPEVDGAEDRYREILSESGWKRPEETAEVASEFTVLQLLDRLAVSLQADHVNQDPRCVVWLKNWHPRFIGRPHEEILAAPFELADAQLVVAKDHGYDDWAAVQSRGEIPLDLKFERAVDALVHGDLAGLREMLTESPELAQARSRFGHGGTLLFYLAANGVEIRRQRAPYNAVELAELLVEHGAKPDIRAWAYRQHISIMDALMSSAHPAIAGTQAPLAAYLAKVGG